MAVSNHEGVESTKTQNNKTTESQAAKSALEKLAVNSYSFESAFSVLKKRQQYFRISTGAKSLDEILGGGIEPSAITEFYGEFRTGKTQICLQLAVHTVMSKELGGLDGKVIYIDTEATFRPERLLQMAKRYTLTDVLENIYVGRPQSVKEQMQLVQELNDIKPDENVKLLVLDSLTSHFRAEYIGTPQLLERQQLLNKHMSDLLKLALNKNIAVVVTNQVISNFLTNDKLAVQAVGGHIVAHASTHRLELSRPYSQPSQKPFLNAKLVDSPNLPEATAYYEITAFGIEDIKSKINPKLLQEIQKQKH